MKIFAILEPFFNALSDGKLIRLTVAWVLRILAVIMALIGLFASIALIGLGFKANEFGLGTHSSSLMVGCVFLALFALAWGYLTAGIFAFRALISVGQPKSGALVIKSTNSTSGNAVVMFKLDTAGTPSLTLAQTLKTVSA